jgi:hypothetical protein
MSRNKRLIVEDTSDRSPAPAEKLTIAIGAISSLQWKDPTAIASRSSNGGKGSDWTIMHVLAKCDSEFTRLEAMGQWKTTDPNSTIIALQAQVDAVKTKFSAFQAATTKASSVPKPQTNFPVAATANAAHVPRPASLKPSWIPTNSLLEESEHNGKKWLYCRICERPLTRLMDTQDRAPILSREHLQQLCQLLYQCNVIPEHQCRHPVLVAGQQTMQRPQATVACWIFR